MNTLIALAVAMAAGLLVSRGARALKLPNVTAFLVAGLIIGPSVSGLIGKEQAEGMSIISTAALGFIAFSIGGEFKLSYLRQIGNAPQTITARFTYFIAFSFTSSFRPWWTRHGSAAARPASPPPNQGDTHRG